MANFGLWDLRLVRPRDGWPNERAIAAASSADHVIERISVYQTTEEAIADLSLVIATTARRRELTHEVIGPGEAADRMNAHIATGAGAGILFGREKWGLLNEEVALADTIVTLPVEAAFASLNIAQAVLILAYEWRRASGRSELLFKSAEELPASRQELVGLFEQLEDALDRAGFFKTPEKRPTSVLNLRTMLSKAGFSERDVRTLRGVVSAIDRRHERPRPDRPARTAKSEKKLTGNK